MPGGGAHSGFARWWRDHKDVEDQIKKEYRTPNQVEQSQKIKANIGTAAAPNVEKQQQQQKTESATVTRKAKPI